MNFILLLQEVTVLEPILYHLVLHVLIPEILMQVGDLVCAISIDIHAVHGFETPTRGAVVVGCHYILVLLIGTGVLGHRLRLLPYPLYVNIPRLLAIAVLDEAHIQHSSLLLTIHIHNILTELGRELHRLWQDVTTVHVLLLLD